MSNDIFDRFDGFSGNVNRQQLTTQDETVTVTQQPVEITVPFVNGEQVGNVASLALTVKFSQLVLADPKETLYSQFHLHNPSELELENEQYKRYGDALNDLGMNTPRLYVVPIDRTVKIGNGKPLPMYKVIHDPYVYEGYKFAKRAEVPVQVFTDTPIETILLMVLSEQQHRHQPTYIELCDTVALLTDKSIEQEYIAKHMVIDPEFGTVPGQSTISKMNQVARLPDEVRDMIHHGRISKSQAHEIIRLTDKTLQTPFAQFLVQGDPKTVIATRSAVEHLNLRDGKKLLIGEDGTVSLVARDATPSAIISLVNDQPPPTKIVPVYTGWAASAKEVRRHISTFTNVRIIPNSNPDKVAVTADSFEELNTWIQQRGSKPVTIKETEAVLLAFLTSLNQEAERQNVLNAQHKLGIIVDTADTTEASS